jgi:hypothetical protein
VLVEALVFSGQHGVDQRLRHLLQRDRHAVLAVEGGDQPIFRIVDECGLRARVDGEALGHGVDVPFDLPDLIQDNAGGERQRNHQHPDQRAS